MCSYVLILSEENAGGTGQAPSPIAGKETDVAACSVELLILVFHGGSLVDGGSHEMQHSKQADLNTFRYNKLQCLAVFFIINCRNLQ